MSNSLNPAQRAAIAHLDGPCLVIAGAGSGKTRVITQKIVHLVNSGFDPAAIGAITFTNKAAREMAERLKPMLPPREGGRAPSVSTFHSLGVRILRRDGTRLGLKRAFSILDAEDATNIVQTSLGTTDRKAARATLHRISLWKNSLLEPDQAAEVAASESERQAVRAYRDYAATLSAYQAVDFDDLIRLPVQLLREHAEVAQAWRETLRYLLVDEYQDTNACQYELLRLLSGPRAAFTAVGDDDQSIYGWRGATLENLQRLGTDYPQLKVIKLEQNYRSSTTILGAANHLIGHNPKLHEKRLWSELGTGDPITVVMCADDEAEAESITMRLQALRFERRLSWSDFAILYRGNHQARVFEQMLRKEKVPYVISGGQSFFERAEIRDLLAYLRLLVNDDDDPAFIRAITTPKRGVGTATLAALGTYAGERQLSMFAALFETGLEARLGARQLQDLRTFGEFINRISYRAGREPAAQVLADLVSGIDYREHLFANNDDKVAAGKWTNVSDFIGWLEQRAEQDGDNLLQLAQTVTLLSQIDQQRSDGDAVRLTTIHAAKGLEFPHVYVAGCEEGLLPHHGGLADDGESAEPAAAAALSAHVEEERRLMYVAVTRAQRSLTLTWCNTRRRGKEKFGREPSRFITEMELAARAPAAATITGAAARGRLDGLRDLLASKKSEPTVD
jgi:ATP-dependent DNA helicase Rep